MPIASRTIFIPAHTLPLQPWTAVHRGSSQYRGQTSTLPGSYAFVQGISYDSIHKMFYVITTGNSAALYRVTPGGNATYVTFLDSSVQGVAYDPVDDTVFVSEDFNYEIVAIDPANGQQTVFAGGTQGTSDGQGRAASFESPQGLVADPTTGILYVTDRDRIRAITTSADVTTFTAPGSIGNANSFSLEPLALTIDASTGNLFVADPYQNVIHNVTAAGIVSTLAGSCFTRSQFGVCDNLERDGRYAHALFAAPCGIAFDDSTGALYVADSRNNQIRELSHGMVTTLAGNGHKGLSDGIGDSVSFDSPIALTIRGGTNNLYVADYNNGLVRIVKASGPPPPPPAHGVVLYDTLSIEAQPTGIAAPLDGSVWFTETLANQIGKMTPTGHLKEFPLPPSFGQPGGIVIGSDGNLWFSNLTGTFPNQTGAVGRITPGGSITEFATPGGGLIQALTLGPDGNVWYLLQFGGIGFVTPTGTVQAYASDSSVGIAAGYDLDLWFTNGDGFFNGGIERISTGGHIDSVYSYAGFYGGAIARGPGRHMWITQPQAVGFVRGQTLIEYLLPGCGCNYGLSDLTEGGDRALWVAEPGVGYIGRMTSDGLYWSFIIPAPGSAPIHVTTGPTGIVWFTDPGAQKFGRVY